MQGLNVFRSDISALNDIVPGIHYSYQDMMNMFKANYEAARAVTVALEKLQMRHARISNRFLCLR